MTENETTRRNVLAGVAAAGVAVPVLAACGSSGSDEVPSGSGDGNGGTGSNSSNEPIKTSDIPVGSGKIFPDQQLVVTQPEAGDFKAFTAVCTHQGCIVSSVTEKSINCGCHGSRYSLEDGSVESGPARRPLTEKKVTLTGDTLTIG